MRLGDLDALKEKFIERLDEGFFLYSEIMLIINNAPTVEPCYQTTSCLDCKNYDKENHNCPRYCEVIKEALDNAPTVCGNNPKWCESCVSKGKCASTRPQGEWVRKEDIIHYIATQYSEHNELVPIWLSIGDLKGGAE